MAGIILGALGGAGQEAAKFGGRMQQGAIDADLENLRSENLQNRTIALEKARISMNNQEREAGVARVNQAQTGLVNQAKAAKLNQFYGEGSNLRPEDISDEEMASPDAKLSDAETADLRTKAAISTGDISPKDAAALGQKDAANETRLTIAQLRTDALNAKTQAQLELGMAKLEAAISKAGAGNTDFDKKIKLLRESGATSREIANFITERKQPSLEDLANGFLKADPRAGTSRAMTPEQAMERAKALRSLTQTVGEEEPAKPDAEPPKPAAKPEPKPAAVLPSLPAGSKKIGTSNGKDVYQAPDGKRYISQ